MVYVIVDKEKLEHVVLVKADIEEEVNERLHLSDTQVIMGRLTDNELSALQTSKFTVITA